MNPPSPQDTPFLSQIVSIIIVGWPAAAGLDIGHCAPPSTNGYPTGGLEYGLSNHELLCTRV